MTIWAAALVGPLVADAAPPIRRQGRADLGRGVGQSWESSIPPGAARAVALIHGSGHDLHAWNQVARRLEERGVGYFRFNLLGHGEDHLRNVRAAGPGYTDYTTASQAMAAKRVILANPDLPPLDLVGISYGHDVAHHLAADPDPAIVGRISPDMFPVNPYLARVDGYQKQKALVQGRAMFDAAYAMGGMSPLGIMCRMNPVFRLMEPFSYRAMRMGAEAFGRRKWDQAVPQALVAGRQQSILDNRARTGQRPLNQAELGTLVQGATNSLVASLGDNLIMNPPPLAKRMRLHFILSGNDEYQVPGFPELYALRMMSAGHGADRNMFAGAPHTLYFTHPNQLADALIPR